MMATTLLPEDIDPLLRKALWRDVEFNLKSSDGTFGRRMAVHEFPLAELPFNEDLGRKARRRTLEGCFNGAEWIERRNAFIAACEEPGSGILVHPFYQDRFLCQVESVTIRESADAIGETSFTLTLVEDVSITPERASEVLPDKLAEESDQLVTDALTTFDEASDFSGIGGEAFVELLGEIESWVSDIDQAVSSAIEFLDDNVFQSIDRVFRAAEDVLDATFGVFDTVVDGASRVLSVAERIRTMITSVRERVEGYAGIARNLGGMLRLRVQPRQTPTVSTPRADVNDPVGTSSEFSLRRTQNYNAVTALFRRITGALYVETAVNSAPADRIEARELRDQVIAYLDAERSLLDPATDTSFYESFDAFAGTAARVMNQLYTDATPVVSQTFNQRRSALAMATEVYGDPGRALEVFRRNGATHPSAIGPCVEILTR